MSSPLPSASSTGKCRRPWSHRPRGADSRPRYRGPRVFVSPAAASASSTGMSRRATVREALTAGLATADLGSSSPQRRRALQRRQPVEQPPLLRLRGADREPGGEATGSSLRQRSSAPGRRQSVEQPPLLRLRGADRRLGDEVPGCSSSWRRRRRFSRERGTGKKNTFFSKSIFVKK